MKQSVKQLKFGDVIRNQREKYGFTLRDISQSINIDISLLAKLERNERTPTKEVLLKLSTIYNIELGYLNLLLLSDEFAKKIIDYSADIKVLKLTEEKLKDYKSNINDNDKSR